MLTQLVDQHALNERSGGYVGVNVRFMLTCAEEMDTR